jgi:alginate O-acetyltransferase complex protein AlgI
VFYGWWNWRFLALIVGTSAVHYVVGLRLHAETDPRRRRAWLTVSLVAGLGTLGIFKYAGFFADSLAAVLSACGLRADLPTLHLILPLGISFFTLQALTYPLAIYHGRCEPTRRVVEFFAFVAFFPQLVAGPIERAYRMLPQFLQPRIFDPVQARDGSRQILNGLLKKVVIADNLAPHVEAIFADPSRHDGATLAVGALFFTFQVYCDFSGYSDLAIGSAKLLGFTLMQNFRYPFFSRDIGEFWRRWHISLSTWLRDYVFTPLGGGYGNRARQVFNVMVTFAVSGLWHGAAWTFVAWGLLNGLYFVPLILGIRLVTYKRDVAAGRLLPRPREALAIATTFVAVALGMVFFRAPSLPAAVAYFGGLFGHPWHLAGTAPYLPMLAVCVGLTGVEWLQRKREYALQIPYFPLPVRWALYTAGLLVFLLFGNFGSQDFIYLQF